MAAKSNIEWTHSTWNPIRGCTRVSEGCRNCYAERIAARFSGENMAYEALATMTPKGPRWTNKVKLIRELIDAPLRWRKPRLIFVNSMSDLFHEGVPKSFIQQIFCIMKKASWHKFQVLTKRSQRLSALSAQIDWPDNVWMGVSIENEDTIIRSQHLNQTGAHTKFLSLEPLLGPLSSLDLDQIDWVIVGGESGPNSRPMRKDWVIEIKNKCLRANIPFFFKQWGGTNKKKTGRMLEGRTWDSFPKSLSIPLIHRPVSTPAINARSTISSNVNL